MLSMQTCYKTTQNSCLSSESTTQPRSFSKTSIFSFCSMNNISLRHVTVCSYHSQLETGNCSLSWLYHTSRTSSPSSLLSTSQNNRCQYLSWEHDRHRWTNLSSNCVLCCSSCSLCVAVANMPMLCYSKLLRPH